MQKFIDIAQSACDYLVGVEQKYSFLERKRRARIKRLGFDLANISGALPIGKLTLVCGADETVSMFLSWLAVRLASDSKLPVVCAFSCPPVELAGRLISMESKVPLAGLNTGEVKRQDWVSLTRAACVVADSNIYSAEESGTPLHLLAAQTVTLGQKDKSSVLVVTGGAGDAPEKLNSLARKHGIVAIMAAGTPIPAGTSAALILKVRSYALERNTMSVKVSARIKGVFTEWSKACYGKNCIRIGIKPPDKTYKQPELFPA